MNRARAHSTTTILACLGCGVRAGAAELDQASQLQAPSLLFSLVRVAGALALVFGIFLAGLWLFRNWHRLAVHKGRMPKLNVLEVKSLGPRHALYVVGYEQQRFLLSSAPTGVTMLTELPCADPSLLEVESAPQAQLSFPELLLKAVARK